MTQYFTPNSPNLSASRGSFDLKSQTSTEGEENDLVHEIYLNSTFKTPSAGICSKAKTSLCKNFTEKGYCSYGKKCQFAHGPEELRVNMEHNRSYKTKTCHAFTKKGYCHYGERCNFIHEHNTPMEGTETWALIYSNHRDTISPPELKKQSKLLTLLGN